jgi:NADPH:quinone reductase-like Zn-dependent oxidoreductase
VKAIEIHSPLAGVQLQLVERPAPTPGKGEILVRVEASAVTPSKLVWYPTTHTASGGPRPTAVPGHEFSGVVVALGEGAEGFSADREVFGTNDWFRDGAAAEYCLTRPSEIALKPSSLTHAEAAGVPISALTAWQGLYERAKLQSGERVLVHGAAGAVGVYAVQLARLRGAHIFATASAGDLDFVAQLGANETIDYRATPFEQLARDVDVVFDTVGGDTLQRSWSVLKPGGRLVTIAADSEGRTDERSQAAFFIVEANQPQLQEIARLLDSGQLLPFVDLVLPLSQGPDAYLGKIQKQRRGGKLILDPTLPAA